VVEDVITKGGRVQETLDIVRALGGTVVGIAVVVDRSGGEVNLGVPTRSLGQLRVEAFEPANCPLCKQGLRLVKPGSA
ncbi:MAG: orotate phosphoribosyltransferase, partial [Verrucomicrobia bacterium]|nr:orotate phosphoribosyltransferase [Verrucomicrobiota bacterium]